MSPAKEIGVQEPGAFGSCEQLTLLEHGVSAARYRRGVCRDRGGGAHLATLRNSNSVLRREHQ